MDASTAAASTGALSGILEWMQVDGQVIHVLIQWVYWVAIGFSAVFAAFQAKRYVDYKVGKVKKSETPQDAVAVDEFVD